jgi:hypothetical protein
VAVPVAIKDPTYQSPLESDFEGNREVFMVGEGEQPPKKTIEEIAREAKEEITLVAHLARTGKRHNDLQDDSGSSGDEPRNGAPSRRHHLKFNPQCSAD